MRACLLPLPVHRYTQQMELTNTGAIPLDFHWHMANETTYTARDFTVLPASGTVLPRASQTIQVEFQPQSVQHYSVSLVMDIPGVMSAATKVALKGECAVPMIKLAEGNELLQFGDVFVHYPYIQQFTLVNDSKLPAKFEVLQQVGDSLCRRGHRYRTPQLSALPASAALAPSAALAYTCSVRQKASACVV